MKTTWITLLTAALLAIVFPAQAQEQLISLSFEDAPLEQAVELYREWTGRTVIKQADLSARITLKGRQLTQNEAKQAIETVLSMNGVALVPMGDKFLKVVPIANARQEGMEIKPFDAEKKYTEADQLITQVIPLRFVVFSDVQPLIQHLVHGYGKIIPMDRINSVLVTDTSANIARIVELVSMVDQPAEKIEPRIYQLKYAEAATIAGKLKELVEAAKTKKGEQTVVGDVRTIPGVIRAPKMDAGESGDATETQTEMIQGEVKMVADDRTNILIIFSKAANFGFFDNIIKVLDVPVDPAVIVEVINLEFAKAKEISGILNEFVGAAKATEKSKAPGGDTGKAEGSKTVDEIIQRAVEPTGREISPAAKSAIGRLSADTKILSDERSNSLLLMGRKSDLEAIKQVIASLDVMLEQVMIEAVILSVNLGDDLSTGVQWVYDTQKKNSPTNPIQQLVGWNGSSLNTGASNSVVGALGSGLSYYGIFPSVNMTALINATKSDNNARILSTPVVLTTDNTEAKITVGEERPVISSSINSGTGGNVNDGYSARSTYQYRNIGITLTVTPNINPQGFVVMEITQTADDVGGEVTIDGNKVPIVAKREISATVAVQDRSTVVLGGLVRKSNSKSASKIPILGDIPLLGWLFSTHNNSDARTELVVLLTPYVLTTPEQAQNEAKRIYKASDSKDTLWPRGWSQSPLRNDEPPKDDWKKKKGKKDKATVEESTNAVPGEASAVMPAE
ncbi:MAG: type II secretion system secretin GspD [Kiritimatiellaceae bacterium]|nr:type II secretion system secretin GspD [Kiritimatiellaceae bacterium]